jgi:hypothetical protein
MPLEEMPNEFRARVKNPGDFQPGSFRRIPINPEEGIFAIIGRPKGKTTTATQSFRFDKRKKKWTMEMIRKWLRDHGHKAI